MLASRLSPHTKDICHDNSTTNTVNAKIHCEKQTVSVRFGDKSHEFNFSKFSKQPHKKDLPNKDVIVGLASIVIPPTDPLEQYLLDYQNDFDIPETDQIDRIFFQQPPLLNTQFTY